MAKLNEGGKKHKLSYLETYLWYLKFVLTLFFCVDRREHPTLLHTYNFSKWFWFLAASVPRTRYLYTHIIRNSFVLNVHWSNDGWFDENLNSPKIHMLMVSHWSSQHKQATFSHVSLKAHQLTLPTTTLLAPKSLGDFYGVPIISSDFYIFHPTLHNGFTH